jgi:hypothetical protein
MSGIPADHFISREQSCLLGSLDKKRSCDLKVVSRLQGLEAGMLHHRLIANKRQAAVGISIPASGLRVTVLFLPKFFSYFQIQLSNKVNLNAFA